MPDALKRRRNELFGRLKQERSSRFQQVCFLLLFSSHDFNALHPNNLERCSSFAKQILLSWFIGSRRIDRTKQSGSEG